MSQGCSIVRYYVAPSSSSISKKDTSTCKNSSLNLFASIPDIKQTTTYTVATISFIDTLPCETTGSVIGGAGINQDDQFSPIQNIGFDFCFYGNLFNQLTICDNGYATFTASKAGSILAPFSAQTLPLLSTSSLPPNTILGAMMDVLVATNYSPPGGGTISVQTVGVAPFRAFIMKWNDCRYFVQTCRTNPTIRYNMKIVLYETTNLIDIYIKSKPLCFTGVSNIYSATQGLVGPSITTQTIATPGRNNTLWTALNSAVRFTPNGSSSTSTVNWKKNGTVISSTNTCPITVTDDSATYIATTTIATSCPTSSLTVIDSIKVYGLINVAASIQRFDTIKCIDSITLNGSLASVKNYKWDNGSTFSSRKVGSAGKYFLVRYSDTLGCSRDTLFFNVVKTVQLKIDSFKRIGCFNNSNSGQIKLFVSGDTTGIKYGMNSYPSGTSSIIINQGYGSSQYWVRNSGNCVDSIIIAKDSMATMLTKRNNYCIQDSSGMIKLSTSGGYKPYIFNMTGRVSQSLDSFNKVTGGVYTISVTDNAGCTLSKTDSIKPFTNLSLSIFTDSVFCFGNNTGKITANLSGGVPNYNYSINGGAFVNSGIFTGLTSGSYLIQTRDSAKCIRDTTIIVFQYPPIQGIISKTSNCLFNANGFLSIAASGGKSNYQYKLNAGSFQVSNLFPNLINGIYTITVKDAKNCTRDFTDSIVPFPKPDLGILNQKNLSCYQSNNGKIKLTTTNGTAPYTYLWSNTDTSDSIQNLTIGTYSSTVTDFNNCKDTISTTITQPDTISASFNLYNPLCFNQSSGKIKIKAIGGTPIYSYSLNGGAYGLSDSFSGLGSGIQTISIRDSNLCLKSYTQSLLNPSKLNVSIIVDSVKCFGDNSGKITLTAFSATPPYTYKINAIPYSSSNVFSNLTVGTYPLSIRDANNCQLDTSAPLYQYSQLGFTMTTIDTIRCKNGNDGKMSIAASGGKAPYLYSMNGGAYQISNTFSNLNKGKKIFTIKDANNCTRTDSIILSEPTGITTTLTIQNHVICFGESNAKAKVSIVGGSAPYSYLWSNGNTLDSVTNLNAGTKFVKILDSKNCTDSISFIITQPDTLKANFNLYHLKCNYSLGSIKVLGIGGTTPYTYSLNGGAFGTIDSFINLPGQVHSIDIKDANNCQTYYAQLLNTPAPISATYIKDSVKCFGTNTGKITINAFGGTAPLSYFKNTVIQPNNIFSNLTQGSYLVEIFDANNCKKDTNLSIYQYPDITANYTLSNVKCYGSNTGSITISVNGGAGGYMYAQDLSSFVSSNTFTNLVAGTYNMKVRDQYLCQKSQNVTITQVDSMQISVNKTDNLCFGDAKGKFKLAVSGGTGSYLYSMNGGVYGPSDSLVNLIANTYSYSVKDSNNCIKTGSIIITQPSKLNINPIVDSVKCFKQNTGKISINASGGISPYTYSLNSGTFGSSNIFNNLIAGSYYLQFKDVNQCVKDTNVIVYSSDSFYYTYTIDTIKCNNQSTGTVIMTGFGGKTPYTFNLDGGPFSINPSFTNLAVGAHTIVSKDGYGCLLNLNFNLNNPTPIIVRLDSLIQNKCNGDALGRIKITSLGGRIPHTYSWSNGVTSPNNLNLVSGNYTVSVFDANTCLKTETYTITQPSPFSFSVAQQNVRCFSENNGSLYVTVSGATPPYSYIWSNGKTTNINSNIAQGTYTISVTDANQCKSNKQYIITEPGPINYTLTKKQSSCIESKDGELTITILSGGTPPYTYSWNNSSISNKLSNLPAFTSYKVTIQDNNACFRIDSSTIDTLYKLRVDYNTISFPKCPNSKASFELTPLNGSPPFKFNANTFTQTSGKFISFPSDSYTFKIIDNNNCVYQTSFDLRPKDTLVTKLVNYAPLCETANIFSSKFFVTGGTKPYIFDWLGAFKDIGDSALHDTKGTYEVTVRDASNCIVKKQFTLNIPDSALNGKIIDKLNLRCHNLPEGKMTASATGGNKPYQYKWSNGDTTDLIQKLSAKVFYTVTISDGLNCKFIVKDSLSQPDSMYMKLNTVDKSCINLNNSSITVFGYGGKAIRRKYSYALDTPVNFQTDNFFMPLKEGKHKVFLQDDNKCIIDSPAYIDIKNKLTLSLDPNYQLNLTQTVDVKPILIFNPQPTNIRYQWVPSAGIVCSDCPIATFSGYISGKYVLHVYYGDGCEDTVSTWIDVTNEKLDFFVPNAFSPDAKETENKQFRAYGNYISQFSMKIYNRWGEKVFSSNQIEDAWDGKFKGEYAPVGVYNYLIEAKTLDQRNIRKVGSVQLFY